MLGGRWCWATGTAGFLRELLRTNAVVHADYVDLSRRMLELARQQGGRPSGWITDEPTRGPWSFLATDTI